MLASLTIQNIVLIEHLHIDFKDGLCALTGETGAGKSILLDSLGLALGGRSEARLLRKGSDKAQVTAEFHVGPQHPAHKILLDAEMDTDDTLYLRRVLGADGRTKAFVNDQPVSAGLMKKLGDSLVEIHGQFDTQLLLNPAMHRGVLDQYAGIDVTGIKALWTFWQDAVQKLEDMRQSAGAAAAEEEYLRQALEDLDALSPKTGEEEELASLRERLMSREQVLEALNHAYHALNGEHDPVSAALGALERISGKMGESGNAAIEALERAAEETREALSHIQSLSADMEENEHDLESIDDRLFALRGQSRKHGCAVDDLPAKREELAERLNLIEHGEDALNDQLHKVELAKQDYMKCAADLHEKRIAAALQLDQLIAAELPPLKLDRARFVTDIKRKDEQNCGPSGYSAVTFLVATNPGADPGALNKIASGGEMSRFMLALKVVMAESGVMPSMIFDEVDAGIGGSTADAVGERLARLGRGGQVLVVTHSPQVAARAAHQWIVSKGGDADVRTTVIALENKQDRAEEIARMLAGAEVTAEARAAANKLLDAGLKDQAA